MKPEARFWREQGLSTRASNALAKRKITSWEGLRCMTVQELERFPNIGTTTLAEIQKLADLSGIRLTIEESKPKKGSQFGRQGGDEA